MVCPHTLIFREKSKTSSWLMEFMDQFARALLPTTFQGKCTPIWSRPLGTGKDSLLQTKEVASCSLNHLPLQKRKISQTREHQKRASVTHKVLRMGCGLEDLVKGRSTYHSRFRSCRKRSGGQNPRLQCLISLCCK